MDVDCARLILRTNDDEIVRSQSRNIADSIEKFCPMRTPTQNSGREKKIGKQTREVSDPDVAAKEEEGRMQAGEAGQRKKRWWRLAWVFRCVLGVKTVWVASKHPCTQATRRPQATQGH